MKAWNKAIAAKKIFELFILGLKEEEAEVEGFWNVWVIRFLWRQLPIARNFDDENGVLMVLPKRLAEEKRREQKIMAGLDEEEEGGED